MFSNNLLQYDNSAGGVFKQYDASVTYQLKPVTFQLISRYVGKMKVYKYLCHNRKDRPKASGFPSHSYFPAFRSKNENHKLREDAITGNQGCGFQGKGNSSRPSACSMYPPKATQFTNSTSSFVRPQLHTSIWISHQASTICVTHSC